MVTYSKGTDLQSARRGMDESAETQPPRPSFCPEKGEEMKVGGVSITPQKECAWVGIWRDGRLLTATLLLALLSSSLTVMSLYRFAALQADLMSLRAELQRYRAAAAPAAPGAPGAPAGAKVSSPLLCWARSPRRAAALPCTSNNRVGVSLLSSWHPQLREPITPASATGTDALSRVRRKQVWLGCSN